MGLSESDNALQSRRWHGKDVSVWPQTEHTSQLVVAVVSMHKSTDRYHLGSTQGDVHDTHGWTRADLRPHNVSRTI